MTRATAIARDPRWTPTSVSNAHLWRDDLGVVVVDPGLPGDEIAVLEALDQIGASARDVRTIVLTHFRSDHSGAAAALADLTGAASRPATATRPCCAARSPRPTPCSPRWSGRSTRRSRGRTRRTSPRPAAPSTWT
ncbi:MBL fold metallo-hydrolase [Umezawaea beigongshangensis]|uniref:MBL fold metallo-hydrolase n=1 Tax=Umezawaea beigongshangensis TaxID=2780383 RepID=UPI002277143A|nr:MBL fold metallo-hydrolase [Umezawaea beigongshangensis]